MLHNCRSGLLGIIKDQSSIALHLFHFIVLCGWNTNSLHSILTVLWSASLTIIHLDKLTILLWMNTFDKDYHLLAIICLLFFPQVTGNLDAPTNRIPLASRLWKHFSYRPFSDLASIDSNHFTLAYHVLVLVTNGDILTLAIRIILGYILVVILG